MHRREPGLADLAHVAFLFFCFLPKPLVGLLVWPDTDKAGRCAREAVCQGTVASINRDTPDSVPVS